MAHPRVVGLTGMPGSGKSEAVRVAEELGAQVLRMGDVVWEEVRGRGLPLKAEVVGGVATEMRKVHGPDVWARRTLDRVDPDARLVVIDGIRSPAEVEAFRETLGSDFSLVLVDCPYELRLRRVLERAREDDTDTEAAFRARDERELSWGLGAVIEDADVVVDNSGTVEELHESVRQLLAG